MNPPTPVSPKSGTIAYGEFDGVIQPQWTVSEDTRGLIEGSVTIRYQVSPSRPSFSDFPSRGDLHPWNPALKCYKSSTTISSQGQAMCQADYIGLRQDPTLAEVEVSGSTASQSLVLHPNFPNMAMAVKPTAASSNFVYYPYVDTVNNNRKDFERFNCNTAPEGLRGADSYSAPRATVRVSFYTASQATVSRFTSNVGTYASSPVNSNGPLPTGGNFLLNNVNVSTYGTIYKLSCEWIMSEQGVNWSDKIYRPFGSGGRVAESPLPPYVGYQSNYNVGVKWTF